VVARVLQSEDEAVRCFMLLITTCQSTWYHIPEDDNLIILIVIRNDNATSRCAAGLAVL
jgi:hypothetical protein